MGIPYFSAYFFAFVSSLAATAAMMTSGWDRAGLMMAIGLRKILAFPLMAEILLNSPNVTGTQQSNPYGILRFGRLWRIDYRPHPLKKSND